jgi:hypothetical protein
MSTKFKVGDKVILSETGINSYSRGRLNSDETNPVDTIGEITEIRKKEFKYEVQWANGNFNVYKEDDLELKTLNKTNKKKNMKISKFKVGDKVIGNANADRYTITIEGYIAKVINTRELCGVPQINIQKDGMRCSYWVDEDCFDLYSESKTNKEITEVTVDIEFVKQAHAAACSDWKQKIEKKFPKIFEVELSPAGKALKEFGKEYVCDPKYKILVFEDHLFVPLPNANNEWSFEAFEFAKDFIKKNKGSYVCFDEKSLFEKLISSDYFELARRTCSIYSNRMNKYLIIKFTETKNF